MESNLNTNLLKQSLLQKFSYAVTCTIFSRIIIVFLYAFAANFNWDTKDWFKATIDNVTSISTWLYIIPFCSIIFAQIIICASVYMVRTEYKVTRIQKFISLISLRIFLLGLLHVIIGGGEIWLYLFVSKGRYKDVYIKCYDHSVCLVDGSFFLILSGVWTGLYFCGRFYASNRNIIFPVIQQAKLPHFKANFFPLIKHSNHLALYPTLIYFVCYYFFGSYIRSLVANYYQLRLQPEESNIYLYIYVWVFATLYIINMNLMRFFFDLFLTEPFTHIDNSSLSEALLSRNIPILQHLACLDFYLLSKWSPQRRGALFTLTQPGAHPHAWNILFQSATKLLVEYIEVLNTSIDSILNKDEIKPVIPKEYLFQRNFQSPLIQSSPINKYENMHNMCSLRHPSEEPEYIDVTVQHKYANSREALQSVTKVLVEVINKTLAKIKNVRPIKYIFGEMPEVHIQQCLINGQLIIWTSQGLANIAVASFHEDPYGIVQKDLPTLINTLTDLKQCIEKLNKLAIFSRKTNGFDYFSFKMKNNVNAGVRLSLCNICNTFGKFINDIPLTKDSVIQLQNYL